MSNTDADPPQALHLLNALYAFYQHERSWVHRTRASLELAFVQGPLTFGQPPSEASRNVAMGEVKTEDQVKIEDGMECQFDESTGEESNEDTPGSDEPSAAATDVSDASSSSMSTTATLSSSSTSISSSSSHDIQPKPEPASPSLPSFTSSNVSPRIPLKYRRTALSSIQPTPDSRWHRRKRSFKLSLGPLSQRPPQRPRLVLPLRSSFSRNHQQSSPHNVPTTSSASNSIPQQQQQFDCGAHTQQHPHSYHPYQCQRPPTPAEVEPSAQLLHLFGELVESRLESCVRVSRLLQDSSNSNFLAAPMQW